MALAIEEALPLAPASQVGRWVESLGGEALAERARRIAEVEGAPEGSAPAPAPRRPDPAAVATAPGGRVEPDSLSLMATRQLPRPPTVDAAQTDTSLVASELEPPPRSRRAFAASVGAVAVLAVGAWIAVAARSPGQPAPSNVAPQVPASLAAPPPSAEAPAPTAASAPSAAADDAIQPSALPLAPPPPRPVHAPVSPHRAPLPPGVSCDPPYTVDANGYRKYKRECASY
jgi:serine/threonine-protein kinase